MQDPLDNITETRGSVDLNPSFWIKVKNCICPCFVSKQSSPEIISARQTASKSLETDQTVRRLSKRKYQVEDFGNTANQRRSMATYRKASEEFEHQTYGKKEMLLNKHCRDDTKDFRQTINIEIGFSKKLTSYDEGQYQVCKLPENQLASVGLNGRNLLIKVSSVYLDINISIMKKQIQSPKKKKYKSEKINSFQFQKFWNQRYILFEKFDEGIKVDQSSWVRIPPQPICEYIANKCHGSKVILDAFAGVGSTSIKLANANSCVKLIANDISSQKLSFLLNNAKVYEVDKNIELSEQDFLKISEKRNIDVVFAQPPLGNMHGIGHKGMGIVDFNPTLDKIIIKSLKISPNILLLLPYEISIDALCSCINKCATELKKMKESCSIKVEKLYFKNQLQYILVCIGKFAQPDIKLSIELDFIYKKLKKNNEKIFKHKKTIKKLRQDYGMIELLNLLNECQKVAKVKTETSEIIGKYFHPIDFLYEIIKERKLIPTEKLQKIVSEQNTEYDKSFADSNQADDSILSPMMEQQKLEEREITVSERTQSYYSYYSHFGQNERSSSGVMVRLRRKRTDDSVQIKRTLNGSKEKRDVSPDGNSNIPKQALNRVTHISDTKKPIDNQRKSMAKR